MSLNQSSTVGVEVSNATICKLQFTNRKSRIDKSDWSNWDYGFGIMNPRPARFGVSSWRETKVNRKTEKPKDQKTVWR